MFFSRIEEDIFVLDGLMLVLEKKKSKKLTMICCFDLMMLFRGSWKANEIFLNHVHGAFNYRHYLGDT